MNHPTNKSASTSKSADPSPSRGEGPQLVDVNPHGRESHGTNRRGFLEAAGFTLSLTAIGGCIRPDAEVALPLIAHPEGLDPGRVKTFASTCAGCTAACGLLVGVRDGRPLKMEGMPEHPASKGGLCAVGQATPMGLYDSHRLKQPMKQGKAADWASVDAEIGKSLEAIRSSGGAVRYVTPTITSPTLQASIDAFLATFKDALHVVLDAASASAILTAHAETHNARVLPHYHFDKADTIVSFGADFLGTWISPVEFTAAWRTRRVPTVEHPSMSHHVHCEGRMSLTGSKADRRYRLAPDEFGPVLHGLYARISKLAGKPVDASDSATISAHDLDEMADRLWRAKGASLVVCDSQDVQEQILVNAINHLLGNYGKTLDIQRGSRQQQGDDRDVLKLIDELKSGKVAALFVAGVDLTYDLPGQESLVEAIEKVSLTVSVAERENDFAAKADYICPDHHPLETWLDAEPFSGLVSLSQPLLPPLGDTRSILESLARWTGQVETSPTAYDILRSSWEKNIFPRSDAKDFRGFWDRSVHDGFVSLAPAETVVGEFSEAAVKWKPKSSAGEYCLSLFTPVGIPNSRHAHNPWLQELPDPITKMTWGNCASISSAIAKELGVVEGDVIQIEVDGGAVELPALIQRGQHDRVVSIALGYGVKDTDRFANVGPQWLEGKPTVRRGERIGQNAAALKHVRPDSLSLSRNDVKLAKTKKQVTLATTQRYHSLEIPPNVAPHGAEVRDIVQATTLAEFAEDPKAGAVEHHFDPQDQLWSDDHPKRDRRWGLTIDMNACTGCSACLIACQSENNVPVVGKDEVVRQREMHWLRIDRYYGGEDDDLHVSHQPMMCQHCDNAPCETVCPVLATVHSDEGLNEQVYNRCVGTRYCANNCPYKVRRFNWFEYSRDDTLANMALNPDVTIRSRGVMEKCSMCVQRIEAGKIEASRRGEPLVDGDIQTACQQSCPAQAIVFGDLNDSESEIHKAEESPRRYGVLEEFNFRQSVSYLRVVRNRDADSSEGAEHV